MFAPSRWKVLSILCLFGSQQGEAQPAGGQTTTSQAERASAISLLHDGDPWRGPPWGQGGPWADQEPYTPRPKPAGWIDPEPSRWPWTGERDPYDYANGNAVTGDRCWGDHICTLDDSAVVAAWIAGREPQLHRRLSAAAKPGALTAQERCAEAPVDVTAASLDERRLACSAAKHALQLLGRCNISLQRPLQLQIMSEVRHPFSGAIFGLFDTKLGKVLVTQLANIPSLVRDTPYSGLPERDFYNSLIVHEVIHGVMHQNLKRPATSHAAYEYPAYALQIESLPSSVRDQFLQSFDQAAVRGDALFSDAVLHFDPFFFAARAYEHFKASADGCAHLHALLEGEVPFIPSLPSRW